MLIGQRTPNSCLKAVPNPKTGRITQKKNGGTKAATTTAATKVLEER